MKILYKNIFVIMFIALGIYQKSIYSSETTSQITLYDLLLKYAKVPPKELKQFFRWGSHWEQKLITNQTFDIENINKEAMAAGKGLYIASTLMASATYARNEDYKQSYFCNPNYDGQLLSITPKNPAEFKIVDFHDPLLQEELKKHHFDLQDLRNLKNFPYPVKYYSDKDWYILKSPELFSYSLYVGEFKSGLDIQNALNDLNRANNYVAQNILFNQCYELIHITPILNWDILGPIPPENHIRYSWSLDGSCHSYIFKNDNYTLHESLLPISYCKQFSPTIFQRNVNGQCEQVVKSHPTIVVEKFSPDDDCYGHIYCNENGMFMNSKSQHLDYSKTMGKVDSFNSKEECNKSLHFQLKKLKQSSINAHELTYLCMPNQEKSFNFVHTIHGDLLQQDPKSTVETCMDNLIHYYSTHLHKDNKKEEIELKNFYAQGRTKLFEYANAPKSANDFKIATEIVDFFRKIPALNALFSLDAQVAEKYTIAEHTIRVLDQFKKNVHQYIPMDIGAEKAQKFKELMAAILLFHDIGKGIGDKKYQHELTLPFLDTYLTLLGFSKDEVLLGKLLVSQDDLGEFIQKKPDNTSKTPSINEYVNKFITLAKEANIDLPSFFSLQSLLYSSDASSYPKLRSSAFFERIQGHLVPQSERYLKLYQKILKISKKEYPNQPLFLHFEGLDLQKDLNELNDNISNFFDDYVVNQLKSFFQKFTFMPWEKRKGFLLKKSSQGMTNFAWIIHHLKNRTFFPLYPENGSISEIVANLLKESLSFSEIKAILLGPDPTEHGISKEKLFNLTFRIYFQEYQDHFFSLNWSFIKDEEVIHGSFKFLIAEIMDKMGGEKFIKNGGIDRIENSKELLPFILDLYFKSMDIKKAMLSNTSLPIFQPFLKYLTAENKNKEIIIDYVISQLQHYPSKREHFLKVLKNLNINREEFLNIPSKVKKGTAVVTIPTSTKGEKDTAEIVDKGLFIYDSVNGGVDFINLAGKSISYFFDKNYKTFMHLSENLYVAVNRKSLAYCVFKIEDDKIIPIHKNVLSIIDKNDNGLFIFFKLSTPNSFLFSDDTRSTSRKIYQAFWDPKLKEFIIHNIPLKDSDKYSLLTNQSAIITLDINHILIHKRYSTFESIFLNKDFTYQTIQHSYQRHEDENILKRFNFDSPIMEISPFQWMIFNTQADDQKMYCNKILYHPLTQKVESQIFSIKTPKGINYITKIIDKNIEFLSFDLNENKFYLVSSDAEKNSYKIKETFMLPREISHGITIKFTPIFGKNKNVTYLILKIDHRYYCILDLSTFLVKHLSMLDSKLFYHLSSPGNNILMFFNNTNRITHRIDLDELFRTK